MFKWILRDRAMVDGQFRHGEQCKYRPRGVAQPGLCGALEVICCLWSTEYKERGALGTVLRGQATDLCTEARELCLPS